MRRRLGVAAVIVAALFAGVASAASLKQAEPQAAARGCAVGFVRAKLTWGTECLAAGESCRIRSLQYHRYGYACPAGRLERYRTKPALPSPQPVTPTTTTSGPPVAGVTTLPMSPLATAG